MRIIGYLPHPDYQITVFRMDDKFSIQIEKDLLVQTYKYRSGPRLNRLEDVQNMVDSSFLERVASIFEGMHINKQKSLQLPDIGKDQFDEII